MNAIIHTQMRARSLAWVVALALASRCACAAPDVALQTASDTALPAQGPPVLLVASVLNVGADPATGAQIGNEGPVERTKPTGPVGDSLACRAKPDPVDHNSTDLRSRSIAVKTPRMLPDKPLRLTLTQDQMQTIIAKYQTETGCAGHGQLEEVTVKAPVELLPMRDTTREIWGGLAAPFWALLHPTQAWRIFLPIPPK